MARMREADGIVHRNVMSAMSASVAPPPPRARPRHVPASNHWYQVIASVDVISMGDSFSS